MGTSTPTFTWDDQAEKPQEQAGGFKWDDGSAPAQPAARVLKADSSAGIIDMSKVPGATPGTPMPINAAGIQRPNLQPDTSNWRDEATRPEMHGNAGGAVEEAKLGVRNIARGAATPVLHPAQTAAAMGQSVAASGAAPGGMYPTTAPTGNAERDQQTQQAQIAAQQGQAEQAAQIKAHPAEAAEGMAGQALLGYAVGKLGGGYTALREGLAARLGKGAPTATATPATAPAAAPPPAPEVSAPSVPDQPGGPSAPPGGPGGGGPRPAISSNQPRIQMDGTQGAPAQTGKPTITLEGQPPAQPTTGTPGASGTQPPNAKATSPIEDGPLIGDHVTLPDGRSGHVIDIGGLRDGPEPLSTRTRTIRLDDGTRTVVSDVSPRGLSSLDPWLREQEIQESARLRAIEQTKGYKPVDIETLRAAMEAEGHRASAAGDTATANAAAHADLALSKLLAETGSKPEPPAAPAPPGQAANLNAAAAALTGKPISDVAAANGGFKWDDEKPADEAPKPVTPEKVAAILGTAAGGGAGTGEGNKGGENRPAVQGSDKPEVIHKSAQEQKPAMQQAAAAAVAGVPGAKVEGVRVKDAESVDNKDQRGKAPETITDHLGGRVSAPTPEAVAQVKQNIEQNLPVVGKDQIDNNGLKATQYDVQTGKPGDANQRSELQVVTTDQAKAMKETDGLYDKQKEALARGDQAEADRLGAQIKERFDAAAQPESKSKSPQATVDAYRKQFPNTKLTDEEIARDAPNNQKQKEVTVADLYEKHPDLAHDLASRDPGIKEVLDAIVAKTASKENSDAHAGRDNGTPGEGQKDEPQGANGPVRASEAGGAGGSGEAGSKPSVRAGSSEPAAGTAGAGSNQPAAVTPEPSKGARITLNDGRKGTVEWYDRAKKQARIRRDDGKMMPVVPRAGFTLAASNQGEKEEVTPEAKGDKWIGVDLDGTLAQYDGFKGKTSIGEPIPAMVARVKQWIADGNNVKILTARVNDDKGGETRKAIEDWTEKHLGKRLEVTDVKDPHMVALYDDRAVSVERNTGALLAQPQPEEHDAKSGNGGQPSAAATPKGEGGEADAVRKQGPEGLLQRQPEEDRGGNRGRVQPEQQGNGPAGEGAKPAAGEKEAKPLGGENGEQGQKANAADEVRPKSNRDRFLEVYERNLLKQVQAKPDDYSYKPEDVPKIAAKMTDALAKGSANKDSVAIRASLKELGVEDTYSAIKKFFAVKGEPALPAFSRTEHESRFRSETPKEEPAAEKPSFDFRNRSAKQLADERESIRIQLNEMTRKGDSEGKDRLEQRRQALTDEIQKRQDEGFPVDRAPVQGRGKTAEKPKNWTEAVKAKKATPQIAPIKGTSPLGSRDAKLPNVEPETEPFSLSAPPEDIGVYQFIETLPKHWQGYARAAYRELLGKGGGHDSDKMPREIETKPEGIPDKEMGEIEKLDDRLRDFATETVALKGKQADNKADEEAPNERPESQPTSQRPAGGGRKAPGAGSPDRERVEPVSAGVLPGSEGEGNTSEGNQGNGPVVRSGSGRLPKPRPGRGSGTGSDTGLDNSPGGLVSGEAEEKAKRQPKRNKDWFEHPDDWHPPAGALTRLDNNLAALEILRDVEKNPRKITDEEKTKLAGYVGWGALSRVFDENYLKKSAEEESPEDYGDTQGYDYKAGRWLQGRKETPAYRKERERWREANKKLRELLTEDEYKEAVDSTINAHYTSPELVRFMWDAVQRMGFKSGNVLEPSMGVGNFLGMMPPEIRSKVQAVGNDKDTVTTGIAKLLYPEAAIYNKPYEDLILPNNEMDLAISNVPFFEVPVYDRNYPKMKAMLHDYFFLKSMDKVKPGGLVAFITSTGTMDRQRSDIREALAAQGDLVAAFRLPSTAFKANAGTDVTTDLIILRKRLPGEEPGGEEWMKAIPTKVPIEEDRRKLHELTVNEYYQKHPENLLGTPVASKKMHNNLRYTLSKPDRPIEELLKEALERLPKNIVKAAARPTGVTQADTEAVFAVDESLEYSYHVDDKGNIRQKREGKSVPAQAVLDKAGMKQPAKVERMKALIRLRQSLNDLMYHMKTLPDDEESNSQIKVLREALKKQYDGFVSKYGLLNSVGNNVFREDPHYPRLLALEHYDKAKKQGTPADIFQKRTIYPRQSLSSVSQDPTEALQQILAERGYADIDLMAQLQGKTPKEAAETLIKSRVLFRDPITGEYATKEKYLSGYVRTKLDDAKAAVAQGHDEYKVNVEELEKAQPEWLNITDDPATSISVRLGGTWIPIPALEQFFKDTLKSNGTFEYKDGTWTVEASNMQTAEIRNQWATQRAHAVTLLQDSLNLKQTTIYDTDGDKTWVNTDETTAARAMQERMRQEFQKWALESKEWKEPLEKAYNYAFNNLAETEYDGSFLTFPGMNPEIKLKSHQVNAVWRIIQEGRALLAHEVGAGKTFEMVASVMEGRRTGVFKKPMIAVPNHIVDQFRKEFMQLYPGANILVPTEKDFDSKNRQRIMSQIATGDYDCVLLPHSQFNLMDISAERQKKTIQGEMDELDETLRGAIEADPEFKGMTLEEVEAKVARDKGKRGKNQTVKELVKSRLKFKERLKELSDLKADTAINFDDTGVDALFIDEAHEYKNLKYFTKMQRISGLQQANSKRSFRLLAKLQYLQEVNNGRGVVFATGTPVQNTMAELYTMMKYVAPDVLDRAGIKYFDDWAANFGSVITAMELSADGRSFKARSKFARFQNVPELMRMFRAFADVKTAADLNLPRPELEGGKPIVVTVPGSEKLDEVVKDLMERAEAVRSGSVRPDEDNMLKITSEGRKAATDLRLLDKEIKDEQESKINVAVKQMLMEYRAGQEGKLTQMAFLDMYRSMDDKENELINLYKDMKAKLVAGGVPAEEIAIVGDYKTRAKRQALFDQVNKGEVRILLGSTQKMGSGTNAQKRLKALHHIDLTWRPGDLTQREGRILRQGNTNKSVRIYNYLTERSFDAYMAQTLQSKAEFLSQILSGRSASRTVTDAAADMVLSLEEMKVAASGNPDIKKKYDLEMRLAQLQTVERAFDASKRDAYFQVRTIESTIQTSIDSIQRLEKSQAAIDKAKGADGEGYSMEVDGKKFTNRKDAIEYIKAMRMPAVRFYMKVNGVEAAVDPTGTKREFELEPNRTDGKGKWVDVPAVGYDLEFEISSAHYRGNSVPNYTMESVVLSIEARLRAVPNLIERNVQAIKDGEDQKPQFQKLADRKDFPERKELDKTREELKEVEKRLGLGNVNAGSQADKEETAAEVDNSKEPEVEEPEDEDDDEVEDGPEVTPGDTPPTKPEPPSDLNTFYTGFLDPALFKRLFPDVVARTAQWAGDAVTPGDDQRAMMRETRGQMDRRVAIAIFKLRDAAKEWRTRPRAESIDFWNAVENGRIATLSPKDQALAQVFKAAFDQMKGDIQKLKPEALQNYIENYFPHIWEQSAQVGKAIKGVLTGKKPLAGKGGFLKRRTIPTMQDGLDMGFTPKSWNPVDLFVLKYAEMAQFLMGHQTLQVMKDSGTAKFVRLGQKAPDGWTQLDDKISTVHRRVKVLDDDKLDDVTQPLTYPGGKRKIPGAFSEDIEDATHGELALVGHYYAPGDAARIFNNFVSKGIAGRSSIYDTLRWLNDNLNGLQLGISAFHATVTTVNAAASDIALGIEQLMQGKPVKAGASMVSGAAILPTLFRTIRNGSKLMREYLSPGSHAKMAKEANAMGVAGGRITQNTTDSTAGAGFVESVISPFDKAINAFRNGAFMEGLSAVPGAILQGLTAPVLSYYVPRMKVGAFYYMAHNILDEAERKNWTAETIRTRMQEAWDSIDDRFGQVVYDNLFWHKGLRDALHLTVRAVGYTYGDIRTYGGAAIDTAKAAVQITKGKKPRVTPRMAFAVGSFLSTALLGGVMTFLWTGHAPQTWKDYTHPRDTAGQRHIIPGYPDQMISAAHDPVQWVLNKQAPIWSAFGEMARNQDYDRTEIRHKDDTDVKQVAQVAEWAGKQAIPFSFTNTAKLLEQRGALPSLASMLHEAEKHPGDLALGQLGFQPAPAFIQNSAALNKAREYVRENAPPGTKTKEQADKTRAMHAVEDMYRTGEVDQATIQELRREHMISQADVLKARLHAKQDPLVRLAKSLSPDQALHVWNLADEKERRELRPTIELKSREIQTKIMDPAKRNDLHKQYREALNGKAVQLRPGSA